MRISTHETLLSSHRLSWVKLSTLETFLRLFGLFSTREARKDRITTVTSPNSSNCTFVSTHLIMNVLFQNGHLHACCFQLLRNNCDYKQELFVRDERKNHNETKAATCPGRITQGDETKLTVQCRSVAKHNVMYLFRCDGQCCRPLQRNESHVFVLGKFPEQKTNLRTCSAAKVHPRSVL